MYCFELGFLSPDGKFRRCDYYGHLDLAKSLCINRGYVNDFAKISKLAKIDLNLVDYENLLLANGWLEIRSRDVEHSCRYTCGLRILDIVMPRVHLSDQQKDFLKKTINKVPNYNLANSIHKLLELDEVE